MKLWHNVRGVVAVEFALLSIPMSLWLMSVFWGLSVAHTMNQNTREMCAAMVPAFALLDPPVTLVCIDPAEVPPLPF